MPKEEKWLSRLQSIGGALEALVYDLKILSILRLLLPWPGASPWL